MCRFCKGSKIDVIYKGSIIVTGPCNFCQDDDDHPGAQMDGPGWDIDSFNLQLVGRGLREY